jgi:hypothetical protein
VDHVGVYAGNGWMIHSSSGNDGVALSLVTSGWYRDHYVYGRRIIPAGGLLASWAGPATSPYGGDGPRKGSGEDPH